MKTCISLNCPYIDICKYYNFNIDRGQKCETRDRITELAKKEINARRDRAKAPQKELVEEKKDD